MTKFIIGKEVAQVIAKHPLFVQKWRELGNTGTPNVEWVVDYAYGGEVKIYDNQ